MHRVLRMTDDGYSTIFLSLQMASSTYYHRDYAIDICPEDICNAAGFFWVTVDSSVKFQRPWRRPSWVQSRRARGGFTCLRRTRHTTVLKRQLPLCNNVLQWGDSLLSASVFELRFLCHIVLGLLSFVSGHSAWSVVLESVNKRWLLVHRRRIHDTMNDGGVNSTINIVWGDTMQQ